MTKKITFKNKPLTLTGRELKIGNRIPNFKVIDSELNEMNFEKFENKFHIIISFPSLNTPVCELQVKEFNKQAKTLSSDIEVIGISKDLPFAQNKFVKNNKINNLKLYSDYKYSSFSINCGLLIDELNLSARAVIITDKNNIVRYIQIVEEITEQPDYDEVMTIIKKIIKEPVASKKGDFSKCKPCNNESDLLSDEEIQAELADLKGWSLDKNSITKQFQFTDFIESQKFVKVISEIAEEQGHHPDIYINYNKVNISLKTHALNGISENDIIIAKIINELAS